MSPQQWIQTNCRVSDTTMEKLAEYHALLLKWNPKINLVAKSTLDTAWSRHIQDSAQIWPVASKGALNWADIGSGAGFPGMVCAVIAAEISPNTKFHMIESDNRKCSFLRTVARTLEIDINIVSQRIESVTGIQADVVSARALASVEQLLNYSAPILKPKGTCLFLKGQGCVSETEHAKESWSFAAHQTKSVTSDDGTILKLTEVSRVAT